MIGAVELIIIVAILAAVLLFGGNKVQEWARSLARAKGEYEKEMLKIKKEIEELEKKEKPK